VTTTFAAFLGAARGERRPARRRPLVLVSVLGHLGILLVAAIVSARQSPAPPQAEPVLVRLSMPRGRPRAAQVAAVPRKARSAPRQRLAQPALVPPPPVELPPPEPVEEVEGASGAQAEEPEALPGGAPEGAPAPEQALELRDVARPPSVALRVTPVYPREARQARVEGTVLLRVIVGRDGAVEPGIRVVRSIPALDAAAIAAIERWRFSPALGHSGQPVRVIIEVPFQFFLR
jgi:periplasmic protein TonB